MNILRLFVVATVITTLLTPAQSSTGIPGEEQVNDVQTVAGAVERPGAFNFKKIKPINFKQEQDLILRANAGDTNAQDEVVYRITSGVLNGQNEREVELKNWLSLKQRAKSVDIYSFAVLVILDGESLKNIYPDIILDLENRVLQGDSFALSMLAFAYENGKIVEKDSNKSIELLEKSAEQGSAMANAILSQRYEFGREVGVSDFVKSFEYKLKAAMQGHPLMQYEVALAYSGVTAGRYNVTKDPIKALLWFMKAFQYGHYQAKTYLEPCLKLNPAVEVSPGSFKEKVLELGQPVAELISHCEHKLLLNISAPVFKEAKFAIPFLAQLYKPIFQFGQRLSKVLTVLANTQEGFQVDCVILDYHYCGLQPGFVSDELVTNSNINSNEVTFGAYNVMAKAVINNTMSEFQNVKEALKTLINSLYPPHASLHACLQAAISGDENAVKRFQQELTEYNEVLSINQAEIDILTGFKDSLEELNTKLWNFMHSTRGIRNREFLDEFRFLKG